MWAVPLHLLLVEDDRDLSTTIAAGLGELGYHVDSARGVREARARLAATPVDLIVLDVALPDGSGLQLCEALRADGDATPILLLTARDAIADRVAGLDVGADDYMVKPFAFAELDARLRALARRRPLRLHPEVRVHDLVVNLAARTVSRAGDRITLTAKEYALLACLAEHAGTITSRTTLCNYVWQHDDPATGNVLEALVRRVRRKIDEGHAIPLIHTVRSMGYRLGE